MKRLLVLLVAFFFISFTNAQIINLKIFEPAVVKMDVDTTTHIIVSKDITNQLKAQQDSIQTLQDTIKQKETQLQSFKDYFKDKLWNGVEPYLYYTAFIFAFMAIIFVWLCQVYAGIENKANGTPNEFKWKAFINGKSIIRLVISIILAIFTIYYSLYFIPLLGYTGGITMLYASIIGANWKIFAKKIITLFQPKIPANISPS